jgi:hypothetical protein
MTDVTEKLWQILDEMLEQQEAARDASADEERGWYHEGWIDALRWTIEVIETDLDPEYDEEDSDEW